MRRLTSTSQVHFTVWGKRTGKKLTSTPKLESLPPTTEVFLLNVQRAHYQGCIWNNCLQQLLNNVSPLHHVILLALCLPKYYEIAYV